MNPYTFHISLYDLALLVTISIALNFALLLWFTRKTNQAANRFLAAALVAAALSMTRVLAIDIRLTAYIPSFSLAFGPLIFFYVRKLTRPDYKFGWKDLLHFIPAVLKQFAIINPQLLFLVFISTAVYLYWCHRLIEHFYQSKMFTDGDRGRLELRWLHRLLGGLGLLWLLYIPFAVMGNYQFLYLLWMAILIWVSARIYLRPEDIVPVLKPLLPAELKQKAAWLKKAVKENCYYEDPELSLGSLAEKLDLTPHELSRIINAVLKKSFNDFINEYRVADVVQKMQDPAYDHITLLGIAFESGFNSQSTFTRIFKHMTGKSPLEYKNDLKKDYPSYNLGSHSQYALVILRHEVTPKWSSEKLNRNYMFRNYLKIAWRNLVRNKAHGMINILGLSVGLAFSLLILLWVQQELSVDGFHQNGKQLYSVYERQYSDNQVQANYYTPALLAEELKKKLPDVQYAANAMYDLLSTFSVGDKSLTFNGGAAGNDYFKMFSFPLIEGNAQNALNSPAAIAVSKKMAVALFGNAQTAIGKTVRYENKRDFKITGVFEDVLDNAQQKFDFIINWDGFLEDAAFLKTWGVSAPFCYMMLRHDANAAQVEKKLTHFLDDLVPYQKKGSYTLELGMQRFDQVYLHNHFTDGKIDGGRIEYVKLFSIVALFILLIACINFMNLTTARSVKRAKEIGVRKVIGAERFALIKQFIGESLLLTFFSVIMAAVLVIILLPFFNSITQKQIEIPFAQYTFWLKLILITLITGLVSGSYPALFLSSFNPSRVLKGTIKLGSAALSFRKGLVVFQFVLSFILIISTGIVSRQIRYIQSKNLGFDRENLVYLPLKGDIAHQYAVFKSEALKMPGIQSVSRVIENPNNIITNTVGINWEGKDPSVHVQFAFVSTGYDFVRTMHLSLLQGRDFSKSFPTDSAGYLINEAALQKIGFKNPIGKQLTMWGKTGAIVGVLKDFHYTSLHEPIKPLIVRFGEHEQPATALVRTQPGKTKEALASLQKLWKQLNPAFPFDYTFSDQEYQKMYQNEQVIGKLSDVFAFLAVFISCLGLLGLTMFTAEQRVKEIGIRKVLGATAASLFSLLASEFLGLVILAMLIASPIAWYAMNRWLQGYAYHTKIEWWIFMASGFAAVLISFITVSFQAARAALANPVKSLRSE